MAHVLNSISFFDHWTEQLPGRLKQDTADAVTNCMTDAVTDCMAAIWACLYRDSEAFNSGANPINCNIKIKPHDISMAASVVMSDKNLFHLCGMEDCSPKHAQELARRFTVIIFQLCILVEQSLELEDMDKKTYTGEISFDF